MVPRQKKQTGRKTCTFDGCDRTNHAHGLCSTHAMQKRRGVELRAVRPPRPDPTEGMLWCGRCKQFRDEDEFGWDTVREQPKRSCRPCMAEKQKRYVADNREQVNMRRRLAKRGLTEDEFLQMFNAQAGLCAICRRPRALDIDHSHETGEVRGLLCGPCNRGIGFLDDDPELMRSAIRYLTR